MEKEPRLSTLDAPGQHNPPYDLNAGSSRVCPPMVTT